MLEYKCSNVFVWLAGLLKFLPEPRIGNVFAVYEKSEESIWEYCLLKPKIIYHSLAPVRRLYVKVRHGKFTALPAGK